MEKVTLLEVARRAGVHPSSASRALSADYAKYVGEATRRKVLRAAEELGYRPNALAKGLRTGRSGVVGVVVVDFEHPFTSAILRGIETSLEADGLLPLVAQTHESSERLGRALEHLIGRSVDAVITTAVHSRDAAVVESAARRVPVVLAVRTLSETGLPTVAHDDFAGGVLAARHLLGLGHRRVAQLCGPLDVSSFVQRRRGFRHELAAAGASEVDFEMEATSGVLEEGRRLAGALLERGGELPSALFAHNDLLAVGAMDVLAAAGLRCPGDVSIIGYDDMLLADHLSPALTTLSLPSYHLGQLAARLTVSMIEDPDSPPATVSLPPTLVVRGSTAPLGPATVVTRAGPPPVAGSRSERAPAGRPSRT